MFDGLTVAMVTPFRAGAIDLDAVARLTAFLVDGGVEALVVSGSTGEAATCSDEELRTLWKHVKTEVRGRIQVVAGTGTNATATSIERTRWAEEIGLDGAMLVTPFYNKPTPRGQIEHFRAVARSTRLPIILYNVPGRTGTNTLPATLEQLQDELNIVAVKEASGNLEQAAQVRSSTRFTLLSGDDALTLPMMAVGAKGVISVAGNVAPREMRSLTDHARAGRFVEAEVVHRRLMPLFKALFIESNPGPAKHLLAAMKIMENELRLPLVPVESATERAILEAAGLAGLEVHPALAGRGGSGR